MKTPSETRSLSPSGGKYMPERWRTSSLSVPYGLEGSGIILFLGKNALAHAHTHPLRGSNTISQYPLRLPIQLHPSHRVTHKSLHVHTKTCICCSHSHTNCKKKKKKNVFDVFLWHVVSYDKISLQLAKITASPEWCFEFCCHFNKLIMWLICSSISMRAMHLTPTQWISIFIHSLCGFTSFKCMWEKTCIWKCACTDLTVRLICVGLISYQIALCVCVRACVHIPVQYLYSLQSTIMLVMCPTE